MKPELWTHSEMKKNFTPDRTPDDNNLIEQVFKHDIQILLSHGYIPETQRGNMKPIETRKPHERLSTYSEIRSSSHTIPMHAEFAVPQTSPSVGDPIRRALTPGWTRDSFGLSQTLKNAGLCFEKMYSIDVEPLFTSVPPGGTVDFLCDAAMGSPTLADVFL